MKKKKYSQVLLPGLLCVVMVAYALTLFGCGAYFNTFYNTKKNFSDAEKKRQQQEKQTKKAGINATSQPSTRVAEYSKAIEKGSKVLELYPKSRYVDDALMIIGQSFYYTGEYIKAQRKFEELISFFPNSDYVPTARLWLGKTLIAMNDFSQAKAVLSEMISQKVDKHLAGEAQMLLGDLYFSQQDYIAAIREFENTVGKVKEKNDKLRAQLRIGQSYIELKEHKKAAESFRKALDFNPDLEQRYVVELYYAQSLRKVGDYNMALKVFDRITRGAITKDEMANIRLEIALTLLQMGEIEKAKIALEDIIKDFPKTESSSRAYYELGLIYLRHQTDFTTALQQFDLAKQEYKISTVGDSVQFWLNNLTLWDQLHFEVAVLVDANGNMDPTLTDTTGEYSVEESENADNDFQLPNFTSMTDSTKISSDSLKKIAALDSMKLDSLQNRTTDNLENPFDQEQQNLAKNPTDKPPGQNPNLNTLLNRDGTDKTQQATTAKKKLKKISVPKSPTLLRKKLISGCNRLAELYFFQLNCPDSALTKYQYLLNTYPDDTMKVHWLFSSAYLEQKLGYALESDSLFKLIIAQYPSSEYAKQVQKNLHLSVIENEIDPAKVLFNRAESFLFEKEDLDSSLILYQQVLKDYPKTDYAAKALFGIGWIYEWRRQDNQSALEYYRKLQSEYPNSVYAKETRKKIIAVDQAKREAEEKPVTLPAEPAKKEAPIDTLVVPDSTKQKAMMIKKNPQTAMTTTKDSLAVIRTLHPLEEDTSLTRMSPEADTSSTTRLRKPEQSQTPAKRDD